MAVHCAATHATDMGLAILVAAYRWCHPAVVLRHVAYVLQAAWARYGHACLSPCRCCAPVLQDVQTVRAQAVHPAVLPAQPGHSRGEAVHWGAAAGARAQACQRHVSAAEPARGAGGALGHCGRWPAGRCQCCDAPVWSSVQVMCAQCALCVCVPSGPVCCTQVCFRADPTACRVQGAGCWACGWTWPVELHVYALNHHAQPHVHDARHHMFTHVTCPACPPPP
jgi:hypothetical protein